MGLDVLKVESNSKKCDLPHQITKKYPLRHFEGGLAQNRLKKNSCSYNGVVYIFLSEKMIRLDITI